MKLKLIAIFTTIILTATSFAQKNNDLAVGTILKQGNSIYYLVRKFSNADQNAAFQRDLDIMRKHALVIDKTKNAQKESDEKIAKAGGKEKASKEILEERAKIDSVLKQLEVDFATNEEAMKKLYGFVSNREYRVIYNESNICIPLTREELSNFKSKDGKSLDAMKIITRGNNSLYVYKNVSGSRENEVLQRMLGFSISRKNEIEKTRQELAKTEDPQEQLKLSQRISNAEKSFAENEENLKKTYGLNKDQSYVIEIVKSDLFLLITPEEEKELRSVMAKQKK